MQFGKYLRIEGIHLDDFIADHIGIQYGLPLVLVDDPCLESLLEKDVARGLVEHTGSNRISDLPLDSECRESLIQRRIQATQSRLVTRWHVHVSCQ